MWHSVRNYPASNKARKNIISNKARIQSTETDYKMIEMIKLETKDIKRLKIRGTWMT